jgi:hypothetical protein
VQQRFNPDEIRATKISLGRLGRQRSPQLNELRSFSTKNLTGRQRTLESHKTIKEIILWEIIGLILIISTYFP